MKLSPSWREINSRDEYVEIVSVLCICHEVFWPDNVSLGLQLLAEAVAITPDHVAAGS